MTNTINNTAQNRWFIAFPMGILWGSIAILFVFLSEGAVGFSSIWAIYWACIFSAESAIRNKNI